MKLNLLGPPRGAAAVERTVCFARHCDIELSSMTESVKTVHACRDFWQLSSVNFKATIFACAEKEVLLETSAIRYDCLISVSLIADYWLHKLVFGCIQFCIVTAYSYKDASAILDLFISQNSQNFVLGRICCKNLTCLLTYLLRTACMMNLLGPPRGAAAVERTVCFARHCDIELSSMTESVKTVHACRDFWQLSSVNFKATIFACAEKRGLA